MKIYAIRDRLIDYYMQPFVGPDDKNVLASVARLVNQGEVTSDIAQAPHQFEVWALGEITEDGHIVPERQLLSDCSSLIRGDIRPRGANNPGAGETATSEISRHRPPGDFTGGTRASPPPVQGGTQAGPGTPPETHPAPGRSTRDRKYEETN